MSKKPYDYSGQKSPYSDLTPYAKKRKGGERRSRPTPLFSRFLFTGRRRAARRVEKEGAGYYVDRFSLADWIPPVALLLVAVADLVLSLVWLGGIRFEIVKLGVALIAAAFFLLHARFRSARQAAGVLILLYLCMLAYHGYHLGLLGAGPAGPVAALAP